MKENTESLEEAATEDTLEEAATESALEEESIYRPREDSRLLQKYVRLLSFGRVLDLGTGSGIQALTAMSSPRVQKVLAVDINPQAVQELREKVRRERLRKVSVEESDLFSKVEGKFNLIVFNPPYLPADKGEGKYLTDRNIYGGKKGWEISARFFHDAARHLYTDGEILYLFSSLTNQNKIHELLGQNLFAFEELGRLKLPFEELYVYRIRKNELLQKLEKRGVEDVHYFSHGRRGEIYTGFLDAEQGIKSHIPLRRRMLKIAIKVPRADSRALNRIGNEARWLQTINGTGIGPRYLFHEGEGFLAYEFVEGEQVLDWMARHSGGEVAALLRELLEQCYGLDKLQVTKEEMHHPQKHIIITSENHPVLLDFERCHSTERPQNVTQCVEFFRRISGELARRGVEFQERDLRGAAVEYAGNRTAESFRLLLKVILGEISREGYPKVPR